jgi:hypothetical protein
MTYDNTKYILSELSELKSASIKNQEIVKQIKKSMDHLVLVCSDYESELLHQLEEIERLYNLANGKKTQKRLQINHHIFLSSSDSDDGKYGDEDLLGGT